MAEDRLEKIKERQASASLNAALLAYTDGDIDWLVSEVERLRGICDDRVRSS